MKRHPPEKGPLPNISLDQFVTVVPIDTVVVHPHKQESVFFVAIRLALILTIDYLEFLEREAGSFDLAMEGIDTVLLLLDLFFTCSDTVHDPLPIYNVVSNYAEQIRRFYHLPLSSL